MKLLVDKNTLDVLALMEGYAKQRKIRKLDGQECDFFRYLIKYAWYFLINKIINYMYEYIT